MNCQKMHTKLIDPTILIFLLLHINLKSVCRHDSYKYYTYQTSDKIMTILHHKVRKKIGYGIKERLSVFSELSPLCAQPSNGAMMEAKRRQNLQITI